MGLGVPFSEPFYLGAGSASADEIAKWAVSLGGMQFELDTKDTKLRHSSVPLLRPAQDQSAEPGKQTLNPDSFFRRSFESWHVGAGQTHFDRQDSNPWRFRRSKGIDVWTKNQTSLLPDTENKRLSTNTNLYLAVAGDTLYLTDGTSLQKTTDVSTFPVTWTAVTGTPGTAASSLASDGFNVLTAHAASGIYKTTRGAATTASHITGTVANVAYGKGRWIATSGPSLYDITTLVAGAGPVAISGLLFTHPNSDWSWNSFAEGPSAFYVGGFSGDKSLIYRLTMKEDGTGLNQPVVAGTLPDGEIVRSLQGYLGFVLIGTSKGVRVAVVGGNGDLNIGSFLPTDTNVDCFEGQDRFVWYGWTNFEGGNSGLGRLDLQTFSDVDALAPAYASDLMARRSYVPAAGTGTPAVTPDAAALDIAGDIDVRVLCSLDDWTPAGNQALISKLASAGNNRSWWLFVQSDGTLRWQNSTDGTAGTLTTHTSSVATGFTDGTPHWIRCTLDVDNGAGQRAVNFYTSDDGATWTQLGSTSLGGATTSIANTAANVVVGGRSDGLNTANGKFYYAEIRDLIGGTIKAAPNFRIQAPGVTSFTDAQGNPWTTNALATLPDTGAAQAAVTFQGLRVFTVSASGVWAETTRLVPEGEIDSGLFDYGLLDEKLSLFVDMTHVHQGGTHSIYLSVDRGLFSLLATMMDEHDPIATGEARGHEFEIRIVFDRDETDPTMGTVIRSWGLRSQPATEVTEEIIAPLVIGPSVLALDGEVVAVSAQAALTHISNLCKTKQIVQWREHADAWSVIVTDFQSDAEYVYGDPYDGFNGTCVVRMKTVV